MARLKPLTQWICDTCGDIIDELKYGWFEWLEPQSGRGTAQDFRIVHNYKPPSREEPAHRKQRGCHQHSASYDRMDIHLEQVVGPAGLSRLLSFIDQGAMHDPDRLNSPRAANLRELVELIRRLHIPYYEEARRYWKEAKADGFFAGMNENFPYHPDTLADLVSQYSDG